MSRFKVNESDFDDFNDLDGLLSSKNKAGLMKNNHDLRKFRASEEWNQRRKNAQHKRSR